MSEESRPPEGEKTDADRIWDALEEGNLEQAAERIEALAPRLRSPAGPLEDPPLTIAIGAAWLELGNAPEARRLLDGEPWERIDPARIEPDDEADRVWYLAQSLYQLGEPAAALDHLFRLQPVERSERAGILWWKGLCHDHLGERDRADRCFREAHELDPEQVRIPLSISPEEMSKVVRLATVQLPAPVQEALEEVPVVIDDLPSIALVRGSDGSIDPDLLGLYTGRNLLERSVFDSGELPPQIFLYRRNLERFARTTGELTREIEVTLLHELGHHLGYEEEDLDSLGLA